MFRCRGVLQAGENRSSRKRTWSSTDFRDMTPLLNNALKSEVNLHIPTEGLQRRYVISLS